jgi:hypothetical protein
MVLIILGVFFAFNLFIAVLSNSYVTVLDQNKEEDNKIKNKKREEEEVIKRRITKTL